MTIPFFTLLLAGLMAANPYHWTSQIMLGQIGIMAWLASEIYKRTGAVLALTVFYFTAYSVYCSYSDSNFSAPAHEFNAATSRSVFYLLCIIIPFVFISLRGLKGWLNAFRLFGVINAVVMIVNFFYLGAAHGLIGMDSVDGSFLVVLFPLLLFSTTMSDDDRVVAVIMSVIALLLTCSSTVYAAAGLQLMLFIFLKMRKTVKALLSVWIAGILVGGISYLLLGHQLLNPNGRFHILSQAKDVFMKIGSVAFGLGTGSFLVVMPILQGTTKPYFIWLHNEPLQVLFEQGAIGFLLLLATFVVMLYKQRKSTPMLLSLTAMGFQSFLQPCFRYFIFALFLAFLTRLSFEDDRIINLI